MTDWLTSRTRRAPSDWPPKLVLRAMTSPLTPRSARLFSAGMSGPLAQWYILSACSLKMFCALCSSGSLALLPASSTILDLIASASRAKSPGGRPLDRSFIAARSCSAIGGTNALYSLLSGSFLSSQGGYAFDYITNDYRQSLASLLEEQGYSTKEFHYNDPNFYSRGVFSQAMGYEGYVCYADYLAGLSEKETKDLLYDDQLLFDNGELNSVFFREGKRLNYIITRSAHLSYKYNEVLSNWGLKQYPEFKTLTDNEETNCALLKAKLVDDMFARMLEELEAHGELENTVIIGITDHYTYGYKNEKALLELSGVDEMLLLERTPCFIWSADLQARKVDKVLNTSDLLPTVLNLLGVESPYSYLGSDAFDDRYDGFVPFSDGSWIYGDAAWDAKEKKLFSATGKSVTLSQEAQKAVTERVQEFVRINNLILDVDYYQE